MSRTEKQGRTLPLTTASASRPERFGRNAGSGRSSSSGHLGCPWLAENSLQPDSDPVNIYAYHYHP